MPHLLRDGDALTVTKPDHAAQYCCRWRSDWTPATRPASSCWPILAGVATWEREIMLERQREGIAKGEGRRQNTRAARSASAAPVEQLR